MVRMRAVILTVCCALVCAGFAAAPAFAQAPTPKVTLEASRNVIGFGGDVRLTGFIKPRAGGQRVNLVAGGEIIASDLTNQDGRYGARAKLYRNKTIRAQWGAAVSKEELVRVRPFVKTKLGKVRLLSKTRVKGKIAPVQEGRKIKVRLVKDGRTVAKKRVKLRQGRFYSAKFRVRSVAPIRAKASIDPEGLAPGGDKTSYKAPKTPYLSEGSSGRYVKLVERRLMSLGYRLDKVNRSFNYTTADALIAFHKVQGLPRVDQVADYTWRALAKPFRPKPVSKDGYHFEIDQTKQALYIVRKGKIRTIVHTSTGAGGATRDGVWTVHRQLDGYSPNRLYYPSYFDGARAVHGWESVPTYPASHGCSRVPMWTAQWLNEKAYIGMTVRVYHS
jgi:hypothetical protein